MNISETEAYVTNWPVFAAKELDELRSERDALAARLAAAERERDALRAWGDRAVRSMDAASKAAGVECCDQIPEAIDALREAAGRVTCADCETLGFEPTNIGRGGKGCLSCRNLRALLTPEVQK